MRENISPSDILRDLEEVYTLAMEKGNFTTALKAKELLGRASGLFSTVKKPTLSLDDLSIEDLNRLIEDIETRLRDV